MELETVYPGKRNKGLSSTFKPPEEGWSMQWPKRCDKHGSKAEDNSLKNVNNAIRVLSNVSEQSRKLKDGFKTTKQSFIVVKSGVLVIIVI